MGLKEECTTVSLWCKQNRGNFVKEGSITVLVQGKRMLSLLKVVLNNVALVINLCDDD